jgi:hypothetical protein
MTRILNRLALAISAVVTAAALALLVPALAGADTATTNTVTLPTTTTTPLPPTTTTTPTPAPKPKPKPKPAVKGTETMFLPGVLVVHRDAVTVPGRTIQVHGIVRPYVPGQWVTFKAVVGNKVLRSTKLRLKPSKSHTYGEFTFPVTSTHTGLVTITAAHQKTAQMGGFSAVRRVATLDPNVGFGARGWFVQLIQARLAALHFYIPQTGVYDNGTGLAVDAYHRLLRRGVSGLLDGPTLADLLNGVGQFHVRFPQNGRHAEGDLSNQLLALIDGSKVELIFPISSGKPSTPTILGNFRVYERTPGYLSDGMYFSDFFIRGYAIHGYDPAPDYPASHGCMRLPIVDAITAFNWLAIGDWVDTYY